MPPHPSQRLISLDAFRGLALAGMVLPERFRTRPAESSVAEDA